MPGRPISPPGTRLKQLKVGLTAEMHCALRIAAKENGLSVSEEARARIEAFREEHRLVEVRLMVPKNRVAAVKDMK